MTEQVIVAFPTCSDDAEAERIAGALVAERLANCVNRISNVRSTYIWDGLVRHDAEILLIIKSTVARLPALEARLKALHSYELPELVAFEVDTGNEPYLQWVPDGVGS